MVVLSAQDGQADVVSLPEGGCLLCRFSLPVAELRRTEAVAWPGSSSIATPTTP